MSSSSYHLRTRRMSSSSSFFQPAAGLAFQDQRAHQPNEATQGTHGTRLGPATTCANPHAYRARAANMRPQQCGREQVRVSGTLRHRWPCKRLPRSLRCLKLLAENPILRRSMETILHHLNMLPRRGPNPSSSPLSPHIQRWGLQGGAGLFPFKPTRGDIDVSQQY